MKKGRFTSKFKTKVVLEAAIRLRQKSKRISVLKVIGQQKVEIEFYIKEC